ncbi:histidinol-phosphate aminotransferase [Paenibacillus endophyticus]|uniref:Histidinol-phosphate aminotransferase n=1 Tax=Paenibacillus endophyticus TaxID=1294268 RepID=A0A7W5G9V2_9BACL|nr:histidinol-phosphate transaminase [Paenibacillus endophyticus]MBB3151332.1 histidinol-phosphate aminotransferase [Paenibacillus endophyticus]
MNHNIEVRARKALDQMKPYSPGKPVWEVQQEHGLERVIKLASNENPLGPSPLALEAMREALSELHRYPDAQALRLKLTIAIHYDLVPEQVIVTNGGDELITLISEAFLDAEDEIVVPSPTFSEYAFGAQLLDARTVTVPLKSDFQYDVQSILAAVTDRTKIIYLCSPNNPTGTFLAEKDLTFILDSLPKRVLVVVDAAYSHFVSDESYSDGVSLVRKGYPLLVLNTFSKIYGLAGIRAGYGIAPESIIQSILKVKEPFNVNALAQAAAAAAIGDTDHVKRSQQLVWEEREYLYQALNELGCGYTESMSNFVLVELGERAERIYEQLMARGIIVRHGKMWNLPLHVRISIGTRAENESLLAALKELWKQEL